MIQVNAYLNFDGNCREAMTFYQECLGGELSLQTVGESPLAEQFPEEAKNSILHASLSKDILMLLGSDIAVAKLIAGNAITLSLYCSSEEELNKCFTKLSSGGKITHPPHDFFAGKLGALTDKYGRDWMIYYDNNQINN